VAQLLRMQKETAAPASSPNLSAIDTGEFATAQQLRDNFYLQDLKRVRFLPKMVLSLSFSSEVLC
jgi:hypothetical protein